MLHRAGLMFTLTGCLLMALPAMAQGVDAQRETLVGQANDGALEPAIAGMLRLYTRSNDSRVRDDLIALLIRAQRYEDALNLCIVCDVSDYSDGELLNLGGAARSAGRPEESLAFFQELSKRDALDSNAWLGQALASIDLERFQMADNHLMQYESLAGTTSAGLEARGYLAASTNDAMQELMARQALVGENPDDQTELKAIYRLATELGASSAARRLLERHPEAFTARDSLWLTYHEAVTNIRLGIHIDEHQSVLEGLSQLETVIRSPQVTPELRLMAERDKVVALSHLRQFDEADQLSLLLEQEHGPQPLYVTRARAHALIGLGRPEDAINAYRQILDKAPERGNDIDDPLYEGLFYGYTDARQYRNARELLNEWRTIEPDYRWDFTGTTQIENPNRQKLLMLEVLLEAWRGNEAEAYDRLDSYLAEAPANPYLWMLRGDISRWRGWPRQAKVDYQQAAELLSPEQQEMRHHSELIAELQQGNWRGTVSDIRRELNHAKPGVSKDTLEREWREQRAAELSTSFDRSRGSGSGTQASREWVNDVIFRAPRNDNGSRIYLRRRDQYGSFDEESIRSAFSIVGYEWNLHPTTLDISAGYESKINNDAHFGVTLQHDFSDHLNVAVGAEINSITTPLRALNDDVSAHRYHADVIYRRDERRTLGGTISLMDFDDGNLRRSAYGYWDERLYKKDMWELSSTAYLSGSANDNVAASYFNPKEDFHVGGRINLAHELPLGYRKTLTQSATLGVGDYQQRYFKSDTTWELGYRHRWEMSPTLSVEYGISRERSIYDGQPEYDTIVTGTVVWRFP